MCTAAIAYCLCIGFASPDAPHCQEEEQILAPGTRVRVAAPAQLTKPLVGTLVAADDTSLTVETPKQTVAVRRDAIEKLWRSERRSSKQRGAVIGALMGVGVAAFFATIGEPSIVITRKQTFLAASVLFAPIGTGVGAAVAPGEQWATVPTSPLAAVFWERGRGPQLNFSVRF